MKASLSTLVLALAPVLFAAPAVAQEKHASKDDAVALAKRAVAHYKAVGRDKAFADFTQKGGSFTDRDLYVFAADLNGKCLAHGANDKLVGRDLIGLKDTDGKLFVSQFIEKAKTGKPAWTEYKWPHPVTKEFEEKTSYCEPLDGSILCVGAYK